MLGALAIALTAGVVAGAKQSGEHSNGFANQLASARLATAKYATDLDVAKADGYQIITRDIPNMGWHFINPEIQDFDVRRPPTSSTRRPRRDMAARGAGVGVPQAAGQVAVPERALRLVPGGLPLRRRDLRPPGVAGSLREDGPGHRRRLHLLAPGPRHAARVAVTRSPTGSSPATTPSSSRSTGGESGGYPIGRTYATDAVGRTAPAGGGDSADTTPAVTEPA